MAEQQEVGHTVADVTITDGLTKQPIYTKADAESFPVLVEDGELPLARVKVSGGLTKNMGNFESLRVDVSIDLPCTAKPEKIDETFEHAKNWVADQVQIMVQEASGSMLSN